MNDNREQLDSDLQRGEGAYVEFKSPNLDLRPPRELKSPESKKRAADSLGKVFRAIMAFSSIPRDAPARIYLGVVEGKDTKELLERVLKAAQYRRILTDGNKTPLSKEETEEWREWVENNRIEWNKKSLILLHRPTELDWDHDNFTGDTKRFFDLPSKQAQIQLKRIPIEGTEPDMKRGESRSILRIQLPPSGRDPHPLVAFESLGGSDGIKRGYSYLRYIASNEEIRAPIAKELTDLRRKRRTMLVVVVASLLAALFATYWWLDRSPSLLRTPALVRRLDEGLDVNVRWSDIKAADVEAMGGGISMSPEIMTQNTYLWKIRHLIQDRIYRLGAAGDSTTPSDPDNVDLAAMMEWFKRRGGDANDTGEGRLHLTITPNGHAGPWVVHGHGHMLEYKRTGEVNNELWGAWLTSEEIGELKDGTRIRVNIELYSCVDRQDNRVSLFFNVALDRDNIWLPVKEDMDHFERQGASTDQIRVYVDPSTLGQSPGQVHVATLTLVKRDAP